MNGTTWALLVGWPFVAFIVGGLLGPVIKARAAGRPMNDREVEQVEWAAAGLVIGVVIACLLIGGWWR